MSELVDRLRGIYRIPITDGLGAVGGGDEPGNPDEFVRRFETPPIQHEAAAEIVALRAEVERLTDAVKFLGHTLVGKAPTVSISEALEDDVAVLSVHWRRGNGGVALIFTGEGDVDYAISDGTRDYTDRTTSFKVGEDMPAELRAALTQPQEAQ